eukprot:2023770-Amphidinium_carterae.1
MSLLERAQALPGIQAPKLGTLADRVRVDIEHASLCFKTSVDTHALRTHWTEMGVGGSKDLFEAP